MKYSQAMAVSWRLLAFGAFFSALGVTLKFGLLGFTPAPEADWWLRLALMFYASSFAVRLFGKEILA